MERNDSLEQFKSEKWLEKNQAEIIERVTKVLLADNMKLLNCSPYLLERINNPQNQEGFYKIAGVFKSTVLGFG